MRLRVGLGILLLLIWYLVVAYYLVLCGAVTAALIWIGMTQSGPQGGTVHVAIACAVLPLVMMVNVVRANRRPPPARGSTAVDRNRAPDLWRMIDELADASGLSAPAELRVVPDAEIWSVERVAMLGFIRGQQVLYLGMPLVLNLEPNLLRAAICHELAHCQSDHLRFGALTYRASEAMNGVLRGVRQPMDTTGRTMKWMAWPLAILAFFYQRVTLKVRQAHEYEADCTAATVTGSQAAGDMLRTVYALGQVWRSYQSTTLKSDMAGGTRPDDPFAAFTALLAEEKFHTELEAYRTGPLLSIAKRRDAHPSLAKRVARIDQRDAPGILTTSIDSESYRHQVNAYAMGPATTYLVKTLGARSEDRVEPWQNWLARVREKPS